MHADDGLIFTRSVIKIELLNCSHKFFFYQLSLTRVQVIKSIQTDRSTDRWINERMYRDTDRQTDMQTDGQADIRTNA